MTLLTVRDVGKAFRSYRSEWLRVASWFGLPVSPNEEVWVLKNLSFDIQAGESIGLVGQNGAGKSTLLKLITGTLLPSEGGVSVNGRISAILELGMGFNPDLTGRQNVYHAASIMGFGASEVSRVIHEIEDFSEIGSYFDEPVRTYSSGMQMRVAFAVATQWRPEILIIDEALSVGDAYFQHKCFDRIRDFKQEGTSLLIVSHDKGAIQALCDRAILLEKGVILKDGVPEEVMDFYNAIIADKEQSTVHVEQGSQGIVTKSGNGDVEIVDVSLKNEQSAPLEFVAVGQRVTLEIKLVIKKNIQELVLGYLIKDRLGQHIFGTNTHHLNGKLKDVRKGEILTYRFTFKANLGVGSYSLAIACHANESHIALNYVWQDRALVFNVINNTAQEFTGLTWLPPELECDR